MHQDTEYDIRLCERPVPKGLPCLARDLTQNMEAADRAIAVADRFFKFDFDEVRFSGFARCDDPDDPLMVEVWNDVKLAYKVKFERCGVEGTLYVDMKDISDGLGEDLLGAMIRAVNEVRKLPLECPRFLSARVDELDFYITMDLRP